MDDAFDLAAVIDNGEIGEAGFVKLIECERAEDFFVIDKNHFVFFDHEVTDFFVVETHNGGDARAVLVT